MDNTKLIQEAIKKLGLNVPYYKVEVEQNSRGEVQVTFHLYGGRVAGWNKMLMPARAIPQPAICPEPYNDNDLTSIPGVGKVTAQKLNDKGVFTLAMLRQAWPMWLRKDATRIMSEHTIQAIDTYVKEVKTQ